MRAKGTINRETEEQSIISLLFRGLILGGAGSAFSNSGRGVTIALSSICIGLKRTFCISSRA